MSTISFGKKIHFLERVCLENMGVDASLNNGYVNICPTME